MQSSLSSFFLFYQGVGTGLTSSPGLESEYFPPGIALILKFLGTTVYRMMHHAIGEQLKRKAAGRLLPLRCGTWVTANNTAIPYLPPMPIVNVKSCFEKAILRHHELA